MDIIMPIKAQVIDPMSGKTITTMLSPAKIAECDATDIKTIVSIVARTVGNFAKGWHPNTVDVTDESIVITAKKE